MMHALSFIKKDVRARKDLIKILSKTNFETFAFQTSRAGELARERVTRSAWQRCRARTPKDPKGDKERVLISKSMVRYTDH